MIKVLFRKIKNKFYVFVHRNKKDKPEEKTEEKSENQKPE